MKLKGKMNGKNRPTCLIITADDFGKSTGVNRAVALAAREGILTGAGLLVNGRAADEAIRLAGSLPGLQVSLHLNFTEGAPVLPAKNIPALVNHRGAFKQSQVLMGVALQLNREVRKQLEIETAAQFEAFMGTGLPLKHVDCHHHYHAHPKVFDIILKQSIKYGLETIRVPYEPWDISGPISKGHTLRNFFYRNIVCKLAEKSKALLTNSHLDSVDGVFGLYKTGAIDEKWLLSLLDRLEQTPGIFEIYTHLETKAGDSGRTELKALLSHKVKEKIERKGYRLIRHMDIKEDRRSITPGQ